MFMIIKDVFILKWSEKVPRRKIDLSKNIPFKFNDSIIGVAKNFKNNSEGVFCDLDLKGDEYEFFSCRDIRKASIVGLKGLDNDGEN